MVDERACRACGEHWGQHLEGTNTCRRGNGVFVPAAPAQECAICHRADGRYCQHLSAPREAVRISQFPGDRWDEGGGMVAPPAPVPSAREWQTFVEFGRSKGFELHPRWTEGLAEEYAEAHALAVSAGLRQQLQQAEQRIAELEAALRNYRADI